MSDDGMIQVGMVSALIGSGVAMVPPQSVGEEGRQVAQSEEEPRVHAKGAHLTPPTPPTPLPRAGKRTRRTPHPAAVAVAEAAASR